MGKTIFSRHKEPSPNNINTHRQADDEGPTARTDRVTLLWLEFKHIAQIKYVTSIQLKQATKDLAALVGACTEIHCRYQADIARLKGVKKLMQFEESYMP